MDEERETHTPKPAIHRVWQIDLASLKRGACDMDQVAVLPGLHGHRNSIYIM